MTVLPECHGETALVGFFDTPRSCVDHVQGSNLGRALQNGYKNHKVLCLIDNDKKPIIYKGILDWELIDSSPFSDLRRLDNHLAIVKRAPGIEQWVLDVAERNEIDTTHSSYQLGDSIKTLRNKFKSPAIETNDGFKQFLNTCRQKRCDEVTLNEKWVRDFLAGRLK